jgi:hypothetical protein
MVRTKTCQSNAVLRRRNLVHPARTQYSLNLVWHQRQSKIKIARKWSRINGNSISRTSVRIDSLRRPQKMAAVTSRRDPKEELLLSDQNLKTSRKFHPATLTKIGQSNFSKLTKWTCFRVISQPTIYLRKLRMSKISNAGRTCWWECSRSMSTIMLVRWRRNTQISRSPIGSVKRNRMRVLQMTMSKTKSAPIARSKRDRTPENSRY